MSRPSTIAIDGPAGSGKSAISQLLAERYGYVFVDTGAFYRAITYVVLKADIPLGSTGRVAEKARAIQLRIVNDGGTSYRIIANGEDVTDHLRSKEVEAAVSTVAEIPAVREALLPLQRSVAAQGNIILAGRDIGTVVLPDADLKLYIDASLAERARRRHLQMVEAGKETSADAVEEALAQRDKVDSERSAAPLTKAADAIYIMTDGLRLDEVIAKISAIIDNWSPR